MTAPRRLDPAHDDAIRSVLVETVRESSRRKPGHRVARFAPIALGVALALGGGGYAVAALHSAAPSSGGNGRRVTAATPTTGTGERASQPADPTATASHPANVEPASTPTPTPIPAPVTAATIATPVILTPRGGQEFTGSGTDITYSGTGTPGTHVFLTLGCVIPGQPDACSIAATFGQPGETPIVVRGDGTWSYRDTSDSGLTTNIEFTVTATAAAVGSDGTTLRDATGALVESGPSATVDFRQGP